MFNENHGCGHVFRLSPLPDQGWGAAVHVVGAVLEVLQRANRIRSRTPGKSNHFVSFSAPMYHSWETSGLRQDTGGLTWFSAVGDVPADGTAVDEAWYGWLWTAAL